MKVVFDAFQVYISGPQLPGKHECEKLIKDFPVLSGRTWTKVKDFVKNHKVSMERKRKKECGEESKIKKKK